jgi:hypothetical protein
VGKNKRNIVPLPPCCDRDHPKQGDRVCIIREEHGWHDGAIEGVVTHVFCTPGKRVSYAVRDDDGVTYHCPKTNDVRRV